MDEERALYAIKDSKIIACTFDGLKDGESALKECNNLKIQNCTFCLRYPLWHVHKAKLENCKMTDTCRAALWYDNNIKLLECEINGIKALRESKNIYIENSKINSEEFGWFCNQINIKSCDINSEYSFLKSKNLQIHNLNLKGKYSFQYIKNTVIYNSILDTKDAFWHSKNVTVLDSVIQGEYLAWYSEGLKLIRCKIIGTQPLCYSKNLVLEDCKMEQADLAFEYSDVNATINSDIVSVKNPRSGHIEANHIGELILDEHQVSNKHCEIICKN